MLNDAGSSETLNINDTDPFQQRAMASFIVMITIWLFSFGPMLWITFFVQPTPLATLGTFTMILGALYAFNQQRPWLKMTEIYVSQLGLVALWLLAAGFIIGCIYDIWLLKQAALFWMLPAMLLLAFGWQWVRQLSLPILVWLLIIPLQNTTTTIQRLILVFAMALVFFYRGPRHLNNQMIREKSLSQPLQRFRWLSPTFIAMGIFLSTPWLGDNFKSLYQVSTAKNYLMPPIGTLQWQGPLRVEDNLLKPFFSNANAQIEANYRRKINENTIYFFSATYEGERHFLDLLDQNNALYDKQYWRATHQCITNLALDPNGAINIGEIILSSEGKERVLWYWYDIAGLITVDLPLTRFIEGMPSLGTEKKSRVFILSTSITRDRVEARKQLLAFIKDMYGILPFFKVAQSVLPD